MLRKFLLPLFFLALGVAFVALRPAYQAGFDRLYHAPAAAPKLPAAIYYRAAAGDSAAIRAVAVADNATSAQVAAHAASGGWVPGGTVSSKFITFAAILVLAVLLLWRLQALTHPEPTRWAKEDYTKDFKQLALAEKFEAYGRMRLHYVLLAVGAMVFAALVV